MLLHDPLSLRKAKHLLVKTSNPQLYNLHRRPSALEVLGYDSELAATPILPTRIRLEHWIEASQHSAFSLLATRAFWSRGVAGKIVPSQQDDDPGIVCRAVERDFADFPIERLSLNYP